MCELGENWKDARRVLYPVSLPDFALMRKRALNRSNNADGYLDGVGSFVSLRNDPPPPPVGLHWRTGGPGTGHRRFTATKYNPEESGASFLYFHPEVTPRAGNKISPIRSVFEAYCIYTGIEASLNARSYLDVGSRRACARSR